ncbi:MAG: hypothetical protein A2076_06360 [Geobacteraceae bacterium GWC2_53_11]|nr:MAG: hypothetical protein A2076_06360 [Geobacteraceae bacterium GWC2_53_11]
MTYDSWENHVGKRVLLALAILLLVTAAVYSGSLKNGFVWDDHDVIEQYPLNRSLSNLPLYFTTSDSNKGWAATPFYRPLARASYAVDYQLFGLRPWGYHLENLLLHLANVLLLFFMARAIIKETLPALLTASFFAIHPAIAEPVLAAFARNTLLALFFALATFLTFNRGIRGHGFRWIICSALLFFLGLLSKETAIAVLPVIAWYCYSQQVPVNLCIRRLLPLFFVVAMYLLLRSYALEGVFPESQSTTFSQRIWQSLYIIPRYLLLLIAPVNLTVWHEIPPDLKGLAPILSVAWLAMAASAVALVKYAEKDAILGLFWGACALVPVLGLVEIPGAPLAERHLYIPFAGFALAGGAIASRVLRRHATVGLCILSVLIALLVGRTTMRTYDWRNDSTLFKRAVEVNPASATAHYNLGNAYLQANNQRAALNEWLQAVRINPNALDALNQLGSQLLYATRYQEAQHYLERAVAVNPSWFYSLSNLAVALDMQNKREEAAQQYERALQVVPPERQDSVPQIKERILQLHSKERDGNSKVLVQKEMLK